MKIRRLKYIISKPGYNRKRAITIGEELGAVKAERELIAALGERNFLIYYFDRRILRLKKKLYWYIKKECYEYFKNLGWKQYEYES